MQNPSSRRVIHKRSCASFSHSLTETIRTCGGGPYHINRQLYDTRKHRHPLKTYVVAPGLIVWMDCTHRPWHLF